VAKVTMPQLGESVAEGTIGKWLKKPGDSVAKYEALLEVITDKVNAEVPSPFEGILREILVEEGETVPNNAEIAVIETADEAEAQAPAPSSTQKQAAPSGADGAGPPAYGPAGSDERAPHDTPDRAAASAAPAAPTATAPTATAPAATAPAEPQGDANARMTPAVRRLLREHNLEPAMIVGTGGGGRITREDVVNYVEAQRTGQPVGGQVVGGTVTPAQPAPAAVTPQRTQPPTTRPTPPTSTAAPPTAPPPPTFAPGEDEQLIPWTQMRRGVATAMVRSKSTVPHAYTTVEVDMTNLVRLRDAHKAAYQAAEGLGLSYVPFLVKAVVETLKKHPRINAHWSEDGLLVKRRVNVGIAVAVEDGLIVPVVHDADQLSISGLNRAIQDVANRARVNKLRLDDLQGGTITVNNTGWFGSVASQSIVNAPQVAIVNMEAIVKRPVVRETPDGDIIAIRSIMNLPVAFDHRSTDGAQIGRFVADIKAWLEAVGPDTPIF